MRRGLLIIVTLLLVVGVLIALNAASYTRVEKARDSELSPDRSTFNSASTGTRALYDFLHESGYQVARWRESPATLLSSSQSKPATLVIVGRTIEPIRKEESEALLRWVEEGGRLVVVDRSPDRKLLPASGEWTITSHVNQYPFDVDPSNFEQLTAEVKPIEPTQPTLFARDVQSVLPSRFAGELVITLKSATQSKPTPKPAHQENNDSASDDQDSDDDSGSEEPSAPAGGVGFGPKKEGTSVKETNASISPAPVVHFAREHGALLIDYRHGKGRIVLLSDPFIVANNGINRAENLQLAINVIASYGGLIAFDEFHQGRAATHNALIQYFAGTPIVAICGQLALIVLIVVWSRGRRFARPLPLPQIDRRSSLEFVASMAELQQRARAYDLALENIYARVRRVLVRHAGASNSSPRAEVARRVALRSSINQQELESLMRNCEDVINGEPVNTKRSLDLARRLRQIEATLGLRMRSREERQAAEKSSTY
jgi:Domain of unknown function (DUF4350)